MALLGFPEQAMKLAAEAVTLARRLSHPYSLANAMWASVQVLQVGRQGQSCRDLSSELLKLSQELDFPMMRGVSVCAFPGGAINISCTLVESPGL